MTDNERVSAFVAREFGGVAGKTVAQVRTLTADEREHQDYLWDRPDVLVIEFTDGTGLLVSQDPEGNGPGWLFVLDGEETE